MADFSTRTYITLLGSDNYIWGVVMLAWSLRRVKSRYPLVALCSTDISNKSLELLRAHKVGYISLTQHLSSQTDGINIDDEHKYWNNTFDKLFVWSLTQFEKVVFLDSDMQVIKNIDFLFEKPHMSAVRADEWNEPGLDKLNSGMMVIQPNLEDYNGLIELFRSGSLLLKNMGDQDIIREYYKDWGCHPELTLSPGLNVLYSEVSAGLIKETDVSPVSVIHYIGKKKPWMMSPRAIAKRLKHNFLHINLLVYYIRFSLYKLANTFKASKR